MTAFDEGAEEAAKLSSAILSVGIRIIAGILLVAALLGFGAIVAL